MKKLLSLSLATLLLSSAFAASTTFKIVGDKLEYRNLATVESQSDFETFTGKTTKVSGTINYDPATKKGSGTVIIDVKSIETGIPTRDEHMRSAGWLDAEKFPTITFVTTKVTPTKGGKFKVVGNLTLHGITKSVTAEAKLNYKEEGEATKKAGFTGSVVQLSASFPITLSDFGVKIPSMAAGKVSNDLKLSVSAYATSK